MHSLIEQIITSMPLQKQKIKNQLTLLSEQEAASLNLFCDQATKLVESLGYNATFISRSYKTLNNCALKEQIYFKKHNCYRSKNQEAVNNSLYSVNEKMLGHMIALALTQFLWKNHYLMMAYFKKKIAQLLKTNSSYLEIGAGHGLFSKEVLSLNRNISLDILDISEISILLSQKIIASLYKEESKNINFIHNDITLFKTDKKYDFISMSEVLEHVDNPKRLLLALKDILTKETIIYITTCANCPSIDHVYLFSDISQIKKMITDAGFKIIDELIISAEDIDVQQAIKEKTAINYSAILQLKV